MEDNLTPIEDLITKEFIESHLGLKVTRFTIKDGTKPGENFNSALYSISAQVEKSPGEEEAHHLLLKCYPSHPSRQQYLNKRNLFYNELCFYNSYAKDLIKFQVDLAGLKENGIIQPAFPPFYGGKAIDYSKVNLQEVKVCSPLDNYILMGDLRKSSFKMADSRVGLDVDHMKLAFIELATMHALSWVYKDKVDLKEKYNFLNKPINPASTNMWMGILAENTNFAIEAIDSALGPGNNLSQAVKKFAEGAQPVIQSFRNQDETVEDILWGKLRKTEKSEGLLDSEPLPLWRVVCHGDCWVNNMLYQYNAEGKPQKVVLLDFPIVKLGCPTLDLSCLVYTSTRRDFRQTHLKSCLQLYFDKFLEVCHSLKMEKLPPKFTLETLEKKFHVSKLVGFFITLLSLPLNLIDGNDDSASMDKMDGSSTVSDMFQAASTTGGKSSLYKEWILELSQELYEEGII